MGRSMSRSLAPLLLVALAGCGGLRDPLRGLETPAEAGINTRDIIDPAAQAEADELYNVNTLVQVSEEVREAAVAKAIKAFPDLPNRPAKNVLCLSGGGAYGAFTAGVLVGWTASGKRPEFDTVTGISTGAIIAPLAFLGSKYDARIRAFYTDISNEAIFRRRTVRGLFSEALADNTPLADRIDRELTPDIIAEIAQAHQKGRRLYIGTTELEGKRFVVWDIGAIATQCGEKGRTLIRQILLGSSAIPGFFPSSQIAVTIDGKPYKERHGDGGASEAIFFRPPWHPDSGMRGNVLRLAKTNVWCVVAGKLYSDPAPLKSRSLNIFASSVSAVIYAQNRGDLRRIYAACVLTGMNYYQTAIPPEFDAPKSSTDFDPEPLGKMFNEGYRVAQSGEAWRKTPPGYEPGESVLERASTRLTEVNRGPAVNTTRPAESGPAAPQNAGTTANPLTAAPGAVGK